MKRRPWPIAALMVAELAFFALSLGAAEPALAGQCPRGQIYRASKKLCIDRAEAAKLGIVRPAKGDKAAEAPAEAAAPSEAAAPATVAAPAEAATPAEAPALKPTKAKPAKIARKKHAPAVAAPSPQDQADKAATEKAPAAVVAKPVAPASPTAPVAKTASPYGALPLENFSPH